VGGAKAVRDDQRRLFILRQAQDGLRADQALPAWVDFLEDPAGAAGDDRRDLAVELDGLLDQRPLAVTQAANLSREAQAPQEPAREQVHQALVRVRGVQHSPDLRLARLDQAVQVGGDHGNVGGFMRVGERGHAAQPHEGGLQAVAARGAVLNDQVGQLGAHPAEECLHGRQVLAQALAWRFCAIAAHADGFVVVNLDIPQPAVAKLADHLLAEIVDDPRVAEVPEAPPRGGNGVAIAVQEMLAVLFEARRLVAHHFHLEPEARDQAALADGLGSGGQAVREEAGVGDPISLSQVPDALVALVPPGVDDQVFHARALQPVGHGDQVLMARVAPACAPFVADHRQVGFAGRRCFRGGELHGHQPRAQVVQVAGNDAHAGRGRGKGFTGGDGFAPVAELAVRQAAGEGQEVVAAEELHLPGAGDAHLRPPHHARSAVFDRGPGKIPAHWHRAELPKALHAHGMVGPGWLKRQVLGQAHLVPPFGGPVAAKTVDIQLPGGAVSGEGSDAAERKTGQHFQGERPVGVVEEDRPHLEGRLPAAPAKLVLGGIAARAG